MVSQPPPTEVGLVFENLEASARVTQLEAEIAQLRTLAPGVGVSVKDASQFAGVAHV
jgi:hypothetical protein